jgi:hypothetical protein
MFLSGGFVSGSHLPGAGILAQPLRAETGTSTQHIYSTFDIQFRTADTPSCGNLGKVICDAALGCHQMVASTRWRFSKGLTSACVSDSLRKGVYTNMAANY